MKEIMNKFSAFFIATILFGCGVKKVNSTKTIGLPGLTEKIVLGVSSSEAVKEELGPPNNIFNSKDENRDVIYNYEKLGTLKFEDNTLKAYFRSPINEELYLQYWQQRWKNKIITKKKMTDSTSPHGVFDYEMMCKEENTIIIYSNENGLVKRVVQYEK
jgi:hypothetical protein